MKSSCSFPGLRCFGAFALLLLLLSAITAQGQSYIFGRLSLPVGSGPFSVASGDFNGDGVIDLVSVAQGNDTVSVALGKADGTFDPPASYPVGPAPTAVAVGDFNGDGNLDLAVTNGDCVINGLGLPSCNAGTISILLGNGDGSFQPHFDYATGRVPSSVAVGDFNGDGKPDLAIANDLDSTVSVLLGNGDGTFKPQVVYTTALQFDTAYQYSRSQSLIIGDFNGDHKLDLVIAGQTAVSVLLGNGDGTFQNHVDSGAGGDSLAAGDLNGDGHLDLVVTGDYSITSVLLGRGDGTFVVNATYPAGASAVIGDLNGDGKPDLLIAGGGDINASNGSVAVLLGNGDGTFQPGVQYGAAPAGLAPDDMAILADFNGDGKLDLGVAESQCALFACPTTGSDAISILLGFGDGTLVGEEEYAFQNQTPVGTVTSADFNGDGKPDLAAEGGTALGVFLGNGDGTFQAEVSTSLTQPAGGLAAGDFNGDGKADLATVFSNCVNNTCSPGDAVILIGNGDGTFQPPVEYIVGLEPQNLAVGDFNGDGKPDLAISNLGSNTVSILLNNGDGTFKPHVDYPTGTYPGEIATGDFNGDGKLDLTVRNGQGFSLLLGNGDGTFGAHIDFPVPGENIDSLAVGDFNRDGKLDLAVTVGYQSSQMLISLGNGDGTFQTPVGYATGVFAGSPSVADFNGDGIPDLIIGSSPVASILLGNGDGSFQQPMFVFLGSGPVAVADFNQDGSPDLAAGNEYGSATNAVAVMLSTAFKAVSPASINFGSQGVGTTSLARVVIISNPSNVSFNIACITASGNFTQTNNCGATLAPGAHCAVNVSFTPAATGLESGAVTVADSTKISPLAIPLSGTGVNGPFLTPFPGRINFATQNLNTKSSPAAVTLVNTGNASLSISGIALAGANSSDFAQSNTCGSVLAPGASCNVNVTFAPTAGGSRTASLKISDTAPGSPQPVSLSGTGLGPAVNLNPDTLTFGNQLAGITSAAQTATLTNLGSSPLSITSIDASGDFAETNTCNTSLAPGGNCQIAVTFTPTAAGNRVGAVTITDNAPGSPQIVSVSGSASDFALGPSKGSPTSATVNSGQAASFTLQLSPHGFFDGTVSFSCAVTPAVAAAPVCNPPPLTSVDYQSSSQNVTVKLSTTAPAVAGYVSSASVSPSGTVIAWTLVLLASGLFYLCYRQRQPALAVAVIALAFMALPGCGGGSSSPTSTSGTPAGTYTATVTGTYLSNSKVTHNMNLTLVVQ
jgi:hypothetical protein